MAFSSTKEILQNFHNRYWNSRYKFTFITCGRAVARSSWRNHVLDLTHAAAYLALAGLGRIGNEGGWRRARISWRWKL